MVEFPEILQKSEVCQAVNRRASKIIFSQTYGILLERVSTHNREYNIYERTEPIQLVRIRDANVWLNPEP